MAVEIRLSVFGDVQVSRELLRFGERADDMRPVWDYLHLDFLQFERMQFASQGGYASGGWAPLAPRTLNRKARKGLDPRILHATLRLRRSLTNTGQGHVFMPWPDGFVVGTAVRDPETGFNYPAAHQHGTRNMPRRRPIELTPRKRREWPKAIQHFLRYGRTP